MPARFASESLLSEFPLPPLGGRPYDPALRRLEVKRALEREFAGAACKLNHWLRVRLELGSLPVVRTYEGSQPHLCRILR
jgi:hypothetical protein